MNILGIGTVFRGGTGIGRFERALEEGWVKPGEVDARWSASGRHPAYLVDLDAAPDKNLLKKIRRADRLSKMAVLAAAEALRDSGISGVQREHPGVIVATAFGAHVTTFGFLDTILDYGEAAVSPTIFSNSVHNAAASYVSSSLDIKGPTLTVTQFRFSFQAALQLALTWLEQKRCPYVLVGTTDQFGDVLAYAASKKLATAADGRIRPFSSKPAGHVPGEGAVFFLLGRERTDESYCAVHSVSINDEDASASASDVIIIDADGMLPDDSLYRACLASGSRVAAYSPIFGSLMTGSGFNTAAGALMLKKQRLYAPPVTDGAEAVNSITASGQERISSVHCVGIDCHGAKTVIRLTKSNTFDQGRQEGYHDR